MMILKDKTDKVSIIEDLLIVLRKWKILCVKYLVFQHVTHKQTFSLINIKALLLTFTTKIPKSNEKVMKSEH